MEINDRFLLHYYLQNNSHAMDALVRNKCEQELLAIIYEISYQLEISVVVESEARAEGGIKDQWKILGDNSVQITLIISLATLLLSLFPISDPAQKELTTLSIEEKKLNIKKLKLELETLNEETLKKAAALLLNEPKISARRSNFYKNLHEYNKVTAVGIGSTGNIFSPKEKFISHEDFFKFVFVTSDLPPEIIESAEITIVSPVLSAGKYRWKGIYEGNLISFTMADRQFKRSVLDEVISFKHGTIIECVLNVGKKLNESGDIVITGYAVTTVIKKRDGGSVFETSQGKQYRQNKNARQDSLFEDS